MSRRLKPQSPRDGVASLSEVEEFAGGLSQRFLQCRTYGHSWKPYTVSRVKDVEGAPEAYFEQVLRCVCGVRRIILLSGTGRVLRQHYDYSQTPGYLTHGIGRVVGEARDVLRITMITRLVKD